MRGFWRACAASAVILLMCGFVCAGDVRKGSPRSQQAEGSAFAAASADALLLKIFGGEPYAEGEEARVRAIYEYLVQNVGFGDPLGLDVWRYRRTPGDPAPDYVENRALSPILFGVGSCEDYAAAMTLLCRRAGVPAQYVAGLTVSVDGGFVDHAWTAVCVEGEWYHADTQLERNVLKNRTLTYRYYLKNDAYMLADHRWGENLADYFGRPGGEAQRILLEKWTPPACTAVFPAPAAKFAALSAAVNRRAVTESLEREKQRYTAVHGALEPVRLETEPPRVFLDGR